MPGGGNCFEAAVRLQGRLAQRGQRAAVVQGVVDVSLSVRDWHSWCELDGLVYDNSNGARLDNGGRYSPGRGVAGGVRGGKMLVEPVEDFYRRRGVERVDRYTSVEVAQQIIRTGVYAPWSVT